MKVAKNHATSGDQETKDVVQKLYYELVIEIVDETHAVNKILIPDIQLCLACRKVNQIPVD